VVRWRGWSYGPLICYESLFGGLARRQARNGADILVNVTSDVWFGTPGAGLGAPGLRQHASHMVLRALETRTPVARAANGGFSFILDPLGRVVGAEVGPGGGSVAAVVPLWRGETLFARTGDLVGPASALLALGLLLVGAFVPRARRTPSGK
jgi:apolipoprotein N-acyltransferase